MVLVDADHGALGDFDVLVQDRVLHDRVPADLGVVQDYGPLHPGPAVHPYAGREYGTADQSAGDDDAVAHDAVDGPADAVATVVNELGGRLRWHVGEDRPLVVVQVEDRVDRAQVQVGVEVGVERPDVPPVARIAVLRAGDLIVEEVVDLRGAIPDEHGDDVAAHVVPAAVVGRVLAQRVDQHV